MEHNIDRSAIHLLHRAAQCAEEIFEGAMLPGMTPRQLAVLLTVAEHEGRSQTDIVERTGIDRSTTADLVRRLMGKRLLQRRRSRSDARAYVLKLTDEGKEDLAEAVPLARRVDEPILDALPKARREEFLRALLTAIAALEAVRTHPERGFRSCLGILSLVKSYGPERIEAAARRGNDIGAGTYGSIKSILQNRLDRAYAREPAAKAAPIQHANIRGRGYYH